MKPSGTPRFQVAGEDLAQVQRKDAGEEGPVSTAHRTEQSPDFSPRPLMSPG